jgi:hypothetical protein
MVQLCVLCNLAPATTVEHVPAKLFFDTPLPNNLITVPACGTCNNGSQHDDEYLRAFLMLLRAESPSGAMEKVRQRVARQLHRPGHGGLLARFQAASTLSWIKTADDEMVPEVTTNPDGKRLFDVLTKYVRGLYFHIHGVPLPTDAVFSIERLFNRATRSAEFWEPLLNAAQYASAGTTFATGSRSEFRCSHRAFPVPPLMEIMVLEFYEVFPYVAMIFTPGTDFSQPMMFPTPNG